MTSLAAVEGAGAEKVLVLHGWALDSSVWLPARWLTDQERFTYAYVDYPGYGVNRDAEPADGSTGWRARRSMRPMRLAGIVSPSWATR